MLSLVLTTDRASDVNILVMRAFVELRQLLSSQELFARKRAVLEQGLEIWRL